MEVWNTIIRAYVLEYIRMRLKLIIVHVHCTMSKYHHITFQNIVGRDVSRDVLNDVRSASKFDVRILPELH